MNAALDAYTTCCAWCGLYLFGPVPYTPSLSHGICRSCAQKLLDEARNLTTPKESTRA